MYICKKKLNKSDSYSIQLVESKYIDGKSRQSVLMYIGYAVGNQELEKLMALGNEVKLMVLKGIPEEKIKPFLKKQVSQIKDCYLNTNFSSEVCRKIIGIHDIYLPILRTLNLEQLVNNKNYNDALQNIIMTRIYNPTSKRASVRILQDDFNISISLKKVYRAMDKIDDKVISTIKDKIYKNTCKLLKGKVKVLFYDATTLYFESFKEDELKQNGYSKDLKFNQPQVLLTVLVTDEGLPIGYEVFPGSTYEGNTLEETIKVLTEKYHNMDLVLVADSGMLNQANIDHLEEKNIKYILGARLKNQTEKIKEKILSFNKDDKKAESFFSIELSKNKHLIISYREARAIRCRNNRTKAIERIEKKLEKVKNPKNLLSNYGYKKFLDIEGETTISINKEKIFLEEQWDGLHGVITNVKDLKPQEVYSQYRGLWQVEEVFRIQKTDLKIRPIYHWTPKRIKSHLALSYIAFSCVRTLQYLLKKAGKQLSCKEINYNLSRYRVTVIQDERSKKIFHLPGKINGVVAKIYEIMKVNYDAKMYEYTV